MTAHQRTYPAKSVHRQGSNLQFHKEVTTDKRTGRDVQLYPSEDRGVRPGVISPKEVPGVYKRTGRKVVVLVMHHSKVMQVKRSSKVMLPVPRGRSRWTTTHSVVSILVQPHTVRGEAPPRPRCVVPFHPAQAGPPGRTTASTGYCTRPLLSSPTGR